jgi:hypothetical protein
MPYDARRALDSLRDGRLDEAWDELWDNLHHQGDVGTASYAAVPELVQIANEENPTDWRPFALVATIEECRLNGSNPPLPSAIEAAYFSAWTSLAQRASALYLESKDELLDRALLSVLAFAKGQRYVGTFAILTIDAGRDAERLICLGETSVAHCSEKGSSSLTPVLATSAVFLVTSVKSRIIAVAASRPSMKGRGAGTLSRAH